MAGKGPQNGEANDKEIAVLAAIILAIGVAVVIWMTMRAPIIWFLFGLDFVQISLVDLFLKLSPEEISNKLFIMGPFRSPDSNLYVDPRTVTTGELGAISLMVGNYMRWLFGAIICGLVVSVIFRMKGKNFRRSFTLTGGHGPSLLHFQAQHWQVMGAATAFNPDLLGANEMPASTPLEWMRDNNIALKPPKGLDEEQATEAFEKQLGPMWEGVDKAPYHVQALCVTFFLNAKRDKTARQVKERMTTIFATMKPDDAKKAVEAIYNDTKKSPKFVELIDKHGGAYAYITTACIALLTWSRKTGGVHASAEFRWLKALDRNLWYALNNVGRRSYHTEGAGPISHFQSEKIVGSALVDPHVDQAVEGLWDYIDQQGLEDLEAFFNGYHNEFK
jgi:hypothetical protein